MFDFEFKYYIIRLLINNHKDTTVIQFICWNTDTKTKSLKIIQNIINKK